MPGRPTIDQLLGKALAFSFLSRLSRGRLILTLPEGGSRSFGGGETVPLNVRINHHRFFRRLLFSAERELADSYAAGEWDSDNLPGVLGLLGSGDTGLSLARLAPGRVLASMLRPVRRPPRLSSPLTPEMLSLSPGRTHSFAAARFPDPAFTIEQAREAAIVRILSRLRLDAGHRLLEIGGWGVFAVEAARLAGCRVTVHASSREGRRRACEHARLEGVEGQVETVTGPLRAFSGLFDRIVALEPMEDTPPSPARLLAACDRLLSSRGVAVLRVPAVPDVLHYRHRRGSDWLRRRGLPGGRLPALGSLLQAMADRPRLVLDRWEDLAPHASRTAAEWRGALAANREKAVALGFAERSLREWAFYLAAAEAAFSARTICDIELTLSRPANPDLSPPPRRRF
jgi:cyclopropane-fatty-acyl-phospholipid synthase